MELDTELASKENINSIYLVKTDNCDLDMVTILYVVCDYKVIVGVCLYNSCSNINDPVRHLLNFIDFKNKERDGELKCQ